MKHTSRLPLFLLVPALGLSPLGACAPGTGARPDAGAPTDDGGPSDTAFRLQLLHAADFEAGAEAIVDAPRFSAVLSALKAEHPERTVVLSSGDNYIPGPFFSAGEDASLRPLLGVEGGGRADLRILNAMGVQASALGNHEFDLGPGAVASLVAPESAGPGTYPGAAFPYLSANLEFSGDADLGPLVVEDGQEASSIPASLAGSAVLTVGDERIGLVGATTPTLHSISSPGAGVSVQPASPANLDALAALIQARVDALTAAGIDKVILLAHMQQLAIEVDLAPRLYDVDVIIAGGSNSILADETDRLRAGDVAADVYPVLLSSATSEPVALLNTDGNYRYVGRLVVTFTDEGLLDVGSIDAAESGAFATDDEGVAALGDPAPVPEVADIAAAVGAVLAERDGTTFGRTDVYLNGRRESVRTEETNLGDLTADANLWLARSVDATTAISIHNGGGIRAEIGAVTFPPGSTDPGDALYLPPPANPQAGKEEGEISRFDVENALRFNNTLTLLTVTASELKLVLESALAPFGPGVTSGSFPQVGGMRFSFDPSRAPGARVRSLALVDDEGQVLDAIIVDGAVLGDPARAFRVVTSTYLADGGDDAPFPSLSAPDRVDLASLDLDAGAASFSAPGTEQDALAEYLAAVHAGATPFTQADTPAAEDERVQNLAVRADTVLSN